MIEQSKESTAPAKGVAVVETFRHGTENYGVVRVDRQYIASVAEKNRWTFYRDAAAFLVPEFAEAVAAAINARNAQCGPAGGPYAKHVKPLSEQVQDADNARDASVSARLAADMGVSNEIAAEVAKAFKPFADLKDRIEKHRKELDERLNTAEADARASRELVATQINNINRRIDRLTVIDPGHN